MALTVRIEPQPRLTEARRTVRIFDVDVDALTYAESLDRVVELVSAGKSCQHVVLNAAKVVAMDRDPELRRIIAGCQMVNADGISVVWAGRLLGRRIPQRVTGIDLFEGILQRATVEGHSVYLLGAEQAVVSSLVERLEHSLPSLKIVGYHHGFWGDDAEIVAKVRAAGPDLLFLAVPSPRKEFWLAQQFDALGVPFVMGVGGSFDVLAGKLKRAPELAQRLGLEWFWRLAQEPRRMWKRYLVGNLRFIQLTVKEWRGRP